MVLQLGRKLHEDLFGADRVTELLDNLLDFVVKLRLGADDVEAVNQL